MIKKKRLDTNVLINVCFFLSSVPLAEQLKDFFLILPDILFGAKIDYMTESQDGM